ncbi:cardiolipin synthase [Francisella adeliensis]|uniref:Cardiolipin synthase n=1 Tax=Francisella adeliensis TaxID=2007306 RepID=A0A2Z4XYY6_9GAMM|nr:cardiolipin synthase [Francisella adeliensis]AXA33886.1 cardiolipin synthase [Francisella adeliensis]MBK2085788.1 cardiolipin synthase [Francisella adeliensis]MBK2097666.1 cardiolipin synthase [Francisella adeliensis]QIW12122.1 cardiolipin synthase [Francisella adeliensis]QIW13996.1 cardiolipin synthase [Francisella adeliensis]
MENFFLSLLYILEANIILFVCQLFTIIVVLKLIVDKKSASNILAWLLAILFIPYVAIPFFFIFQRKDTRKFWQKEKMSIKQPHVKEFCLVDNNSCEKLPTNTINVFSNMELNTLTSQNTFEMYTDGVESFDSFIDSINSAKKNIYIQTYVFKNDSTSKLIVQALEKKASEGIEIKMLIDSLGSFYVYRHNKRIFKNLRKLGAEIVFFMPVISNPLRNYINFRNHRKIYIFDNHTVFSGGMNIGDEYMSPIAHEGMWDDLLFKIQGESLSYFLKIFSSDWHFATNQELQFTPSTPVEEEGFVQVIPSGPDLQQDQLYAGLLTAINSAKEKVWIITPYLIPSAELYQTIILAKRRGLEVKVITPKSSNHKIVDKARDSYTRDFVACGIDVHFTANMMHAKAVLIDDNLAMLGSVNLDNRSLFLNYEIATFLYSSHHVGEVYKWATKLLEDSTLKTDHMSNKRSSLIAESFLKILTPLM